jgi:hypothetical protein
MRVSNRRARQLVGARERRVGSAGAPRRTRSNRRRCRVEIVERGAPLSRSSSTVAVAAMPDENAKPSVPDSSAATQRSYAHRVGLCVRA